jgi:hypothetical protein
MAQVTARPLTKYDYGILPEAGPRYQLINGNLFMAPAPNRFHQDISRTIQFEMMKYLEVQPVGIVYNAPFDVVLTDINVFQPDLAFFSERHAVLSQKREQREHLISWSRSSRRRPRISISIKNGWSTRAPASMSCGSSIRREKKSGCTTFAKIRIDQKSF